MQSLEGNTVDVSVHSPKAGYEINQTLYGDIYDLLRAVDTEPVNDIISYALANLSGYQGTIFPHQLAFDIAVKKIVEKYKGPINEGVDIIKNLMVTCVEECIENRFKSYPKLKDVSFNLVRQTVEKNVRLTNTNLNCYLNAQQAFINIRHPDFVQDISSYSNEIQLIPTGTLSQYQNGSNNSVPESKSNFYLEGNMRRQESKTNKNKFNKSYVRPFLCWLRQKVIAIPLKIEEIESRIPFILYFDALVVPKS